MKYPKGYVPEPNTGCYLWLGWLNRDGYGTVIVKGHRRSAHRWVYEQEHGPVPSGMFLDHLCRLPSCVNPAHLEPVTNKENVLRGIGLTAQQARQTECQRGHADWRRKGNGRRYCLECARVRARSYRHAVL